MLLCIITGMYLCWWAGRSTEPLGLVKTEFPPPGYLGGKCTEAAKGIGKHVRFVGQSCVLCCSAC